MNYETFKNTLVPMIQTTLGEDAKVNLQCIPQNNGIRWDGLSIMKEGEKIAPTIYLDDLYGRYENGKTMEEILKFILESYENRCDLTDLSVNEFEDFEKVKESIYYKLVNYQWNEELLKNVPHVKYLDLAMVFYYRLESSVLEGATVLIHKGTMKLWNITMEELCRAAENNTPQKLPYTFQGMEALLNQMILEEGEETEVKEILTESPHKNEIMYVLTNRDKYFGAACILYPHVLKHISVLVGGSFYILPSSIHECILVPDSGQYSSVELIEMVTEINTSQVEPVEVLSNNVYFYDKEKDIIHM